MSAAKAVVGYLESEGEVQNKCNGRTGRQSIRSPKAIAVRQPLTQFLAQKGNQRINHGLLYK
jgi:hypothetical protein